MTSFWNLEVQDFWSNYVSRIKDHPKIKKKKLKVTLANQMQMILTVNSFSNKRFFLDKIKKRQSWRITKFLVLSSKINDSLNFYKFVNSNILFLLKIRNKLKLILTKY